MSNNRSMNSIRSIMGGGSAFQAPDKLLDDCLPVPNSSQPKDHQGGRPFPVMKMAPPDQRCVRCAQQLCTAELTAFPGFISRLRPRACLCLLLRACGFPGRSADKMTR